MIPLTKWNLRPVKLSPWSILLKWPRRATAEANGNSMGRPALDPGAKCIELNELSQTTGWFSRTGGQRATTTYGHPILARPAKTMLSFIKAKSVAKKAGDGWCRRLLVARTRQDHRERPSGPRAARACRSAASAAPRSTRGA